MTADALFRFLDAQFDDCDLEDVIEAIEALVAEAGFDYFTLTRQLRINDSPEKIVLTGCWPQGWPEVYVQKKYAAVDPTVRYLGHAQRGFRWNEAFDRYGEDAHRRRIDRMLVDARRFGLDDGYVFPVHGRRGLVGSLTLGGRVVELTAGQMALMDAVAKKAFWSVLARTDPEASDEMSAPVDMQMTRREMEALTYLAKGMTSIEMGSTLSLSAHTVDWYMNGIQDKLKARNRHHAVAIAFRLGLIS